MAQRRCPPGSVAIDTADALRDPERSQTQHHGQQSHEAIAGEFPLGPAAHDAARGKGCQAQRQLLAVEPR